MFCLFISDMLHVAPGFSFNYWASFLTVIPCFILRYWPDIQYWHQCQVIPQPETCRLKEVTLTPHLRLTNSALCQPQPSHHGRIYMIPILERRAVSRCTHHITSSRKMICSRFKQLFVLWKDLGKIIVKSIFFPIIKYLYNVKFSISTKFLKV